MIQKTLILIIITLTLLVSNAQQCLTYESFSIGGTDTTKTKVWRVGDRLRLESGDAPIAHPIPGIATHYTYVDYAADTVITQLCYKDGDRYFCGYGLKNDYTFTKEGEEKLNGYHCTKYSITLFSNKIELWFTNDLKFRATPTVSFGNLPGVMVQCRRNGSAITRLSHISKESFKGELFPQDFGTVKTLRELNQIEKEKLVITIPVFNDEQICFDPSIPKPDGIPYDSVLHFANGTLILKRIDMTQLPEHYQIFAEVTEYSNGDAYDRTGSIFLIPPSMPISMLRALIDSVDVLPYFNDKSGNRYYGFVKTDTYLPPVELIRFFTPFGVRHYNEYRSLPDAEWADAVHYKQDISDFRSVLSGDVFIGAFIGNYDKGGHKLSLTLKAYPEEYEWRFDTTEVERVLPLFNTCNVMEMAGQNYGRFFGTDSLTVTFTVLKEMTNLRLRYITTGHGGWDNGDEFVPKANTILIDGKPRFEYTPWRCDCGTYRTANPASGNFWNGMSSSDYSRSGWCPGTATQPVYFDLSDLPEGEHTMTIAIPQGKPEGNSFSAWSVSGALIAKIKIQ